MMSKEPNAPGGAANVNPAIDVQRGPIGTGGGYSGQEYDSDGHAIPKAMNASTTGQDVDSTGRDDADIPPDNGKRASFDYATGAVHGSGAGAGGGNEGEDFSSDSATGDGFPRTGAGSGDKLGK